MGVRRASGADHVVDRTAIANHPTTKLNAAKVADRAAETVKPPARKAAEAKTLPPPDQVPQIDEDDSSITRPSGKRLRIRRSSGKLEAAQPCIVEETVVADLRRDPRSEK